MYCYADGCISVRIYYFKVLWRCLPIGKKDNIQINEEIHDKELRIIGSDGQQLGIMSAKDALNLAEQKNLDLVKIAPHSNPPVCKIMDYGKYRFEQAKREKEARKNQRVVDIKEVRLSLNIDTHDFEFKCKNAEKFLKDGNKVKITVRFRGREMNYVKLGENVLNKFMESLKDISNVEKKPLLEGKNMFIILSPKPSK